MSTGELEPPPESFETKAGEFSANSQWALRGIYEISSILTRPQRLELTLSNIVSVVSEHFQLQNCLIILLSDSHEPRLVVGPAWNESTDGSHFGPLPESLLANLVETRKPVVGKRNDFLSSDLVTTEGCTYQSSSLLGVPILDRDK